MLRSSGSSEPRDLPGFRLRGREVMRLESFSDAVFGFALTLLVVSLDVPKTFNNLVTTMRGFPAFALCFLFLTLIWNGHYKFCRRYGLDDGPTRLLTCIMLFLVLFYVYPLKFLFNFSFNGLFDSVPPASMNRSQFSTLLVIYGLGFAAVYGAMTLLYLHAYRLREALELNDLEKFDTRYQIFRLVTLTAFGLIAAGLACTPIFRNWSSLVYILIFPVLRTARGIHRRRRAPYLAVMKDERTE